MKSNRVIILIVASIVLFSLLLNSINFYYCSNRKELFNTPINQLEKKPHSSSYWNLTGTPIFIDDSLNGPGAHNWTWFENQAWYGGGNGTSENPYIIENITIDGQGIGSCISIGHSSKYFIIRNCTFYNSGSDLDQDGGIRFEAVNNGKIFNNNCSYNNAHGILIKSGYNGIISKNTLSNNNQYGLGMYICAYLLITLNNISNNNDGIYIDTNMNANNIAHNRIYNNYNNGIRLSFTRRNNISINRIYNNEQSGIFINAGFGDSLNNNEIYDNDYTGIEMDLCSSIITSRNNISKNEYGIHLEDRGYNQFFENNISFNTKTGILIKNSADNIITNNKIMNNEIGLDFQNAFNTYLSGCEIINNTFGLKLDSSNNNSIIGNIFNGNGTPLDQKNCEGNYFEDNIGLPNQNVKFPLEIVILILISIIALSSIIAIITIGKRISKIRSSQKELGSKKKLSSHDLKELRKTEAEVNIEKESHVCVVHRGKIVGPIYICPTCENYYCMKCATILKEKNEKCWVCNSEIEI